MGLAIWFGSDAACCVVGVVKPGGTTVCVDGAVGSGFDGDAGLAAGAAVERGGLVGVVVGALVAGGALGTAG